MSRVVIALAVSAAFCLASPGFHEDSWAEAEEQLSTSTCNRDTGGSCYLSSCYPWRHGASCSLGTCMCPQGQCAYQGQCLPAGQSVPPPPPPVCEMKTGGTCRLTACDSWRNAQCSGFSMGFSSGITLGQCVCKPGTCAVDGKCVPQERAPPKTLEAKKIVCPVLASIYNSGLFDADSYGRVERLDVQQGCKKGLNMDENTAFFFGITTAGYKQADIDSINFSMEPIDVAQKLLKEKATEEPGPEYLRYLNIFEMATNKDVMHQIGAAVRGGPPDQECHGVWPCKSRYDHFFGQFANAQGRFYIKDWGNVASHIWEKGYHGPGGTSLFSIGLGISGREFMALCGYFIAFSKEDENGERYIPEEWLKTMQMHGVFPEDWKQPALWGFEATIKCMGDFVELGVNGVPNQLKLQVAINKIVG